MTGAPDQETGPFVIVLDSLCEGWQVMGNGDGEPEQFATREEAESEILSDERDLFDNRAASGQLEDGEARPETLDDCEAFVVPLSEYIQGRRAIWTGAGIVITGDAAPVAPVAPDAAPAPSLADILVSIAAAPVALSEALKIEIFMCLWSAIEDRLLLSDTGEHAARWKAYHGETGVYAMRSQLISLDPCEATERAWFAFLGGDVEICYAWDLEFLPWFVDYCLCTDGFAISLHADYLTRAAFHGWQYRAADIAREVWKYDGFVYDEGEGAARRAFNAGETPAQFVAWYAEKYDLIKFD
jgi:hypothetical protein